MMEDDLSCPPGMKPAEEDIEDADVHYEISSLLVSNSQKYTSAEAKLRILSCCLDLGMSTTNEIKYPDIQKAYEKKFNIKLYKEELIDLFNHRKPTKAFKLGLTKFVDVIEAAENEDQVIKVKLKENSESFIKELEESYYGDPIPSLTAEEVHLILNPPQREYYNYNNPRGGYNGGNVRGSWRGGDNSNMEPCGRGRSFHQPNNGFNNRGRFNQNRPNNYQNYGRQQYNGNFQSGNMNHQGPNSYSKYYRGPMAALAREKELKNAEKQRIKNEMESLDQVVADTIRQLEEEKQRLLEDVQEEFLSNIHNLYTAYYDRLEAIEKHGLQQNESLCIGWQKIQEDKERPL